MATLRVELNSKPRQDGLHLLMIRITQNKKLKRVSAERFIKKSEFNRKAEFGKWVRTTNPGHKVINEHLRELISKYEEAQTEIIKRGSNLTLNNIRQKGSQKMDDQFIPYGLMEVERSKAKGLYRTSVKKKQLVNKIEAFAGSQVCFSDIDVTFLKRYTHDQLSKEKKLNTIGTDHKALRSIIKSAIADGVVRPENNLYLIFRIQWQKTNRAKLTELEIQAIEELNLVNDSLVTVVRDMFLFSYYTAGMRFSDVLLLQWKNIREGRLFYQMTKTGDIQNIFLVDKAKNILETYRNPSTDQTDYVFPLLHSTAVPADYVGRTRIISAKNALVNKYLTKIMEKAEITKRVSFHISRHSYAFMAISKTGDLYAVSKSLNHKNLGTTNVYMKENDNVAADKILREVFSA
ncbi:MAG: tyrosine-type recombinase/integrase [Bacteroidota bacterium]